MHKHLQNLDRLSQKLQLRYGEYDELVMQLKHEFESVEAQIFNMLSNIPHYRHEGNASTTSSADPVQRLPGAVARQQKAH